MLSISFGNFVSVLTFGNFFGMKEILYFYFSLNLKASGLSSFYRNFLYLILYLIIFQHIFEFFNMCLRSTPEPLIMD